jgi:hypothetical protein
VTYTQRENAALAVVVADYIHTHKHTHDPGDCAMCPVLESLPADLLVKARAFEDFADGAA